MLAGRSLRNWLRPRTTHRIRQSLRNRTQLRLRPLEDRAVPTVYTVNTLVDENDGYGVGNNSLRDAINAANADVTAGPHTVDATGVTGIISLVNNQITISGTKALIIDGPGAGSLTISNGSGAGPTSRIFDVTSTQALTINNVTISGGDVTGANNGGAIKSATTSLTLSGVTLSGNKTGGAGGAIATVTAASTVTLTNVTMSGNTATGAGGALHLGASATVTVNGSSFTGNSSGSTGGAINASSTVKLDALTNTSFGNNTATSTGGAIHTASSGTITLNTASVTNNQSGGNGGAANNAGTATWNLVSSSFTGNKGAAGGAFRFAGTATVSVQKSTISGNTATGVGGGVYFVTGGTLTADYSTFSGNVAGGNGGGIRGSSASITLRNSTVSGNQSGGTSGGGGIYLTTGPLTIQNSTVAFNKATNASGFGGGIRKTSTTGAVTIQSSIIAKNSAVGAGGQDIHNSSTATLNVAGGDNIVTDQAFGNFTLAGTNYSTDPKLLPLSNNGGPTLTHKFAYSSDALNKGNNIAGKSFDQIGNARVDPVFLVADIGAVEGPINYPFADSHTLTDVPPGGAPYTFSVTIDDETGVNSGLLATGDIVVTGPGGFIVINPTFTGSSSGGGNKVITNWSFNPPGGTWDPTEGGVYSVAFVPGKVTDTDFPTHTNPGELIGTFKVVVVGTLTVDNNATDTDDGNYTSGNLTLREAINLSNNSIGGTDTIQFAGSLNGQTISLSSELGITDSVVINGSGITNTLISGKTGIRLFNINIPGASNPVTMSGMKLFGGDVTGSGGAITMSDDSLTMKSMLVTGNTASSSGGAVLLTTGALVVEDSVVSFNTAGSSTGGAFDMTTGSISVTRSTIDNNSAGSNGGVADFTTGSFTAIDSTLSNNQAKGSASTNGGGAINLTSGSVTIVNSTLSGNSAPNGLATGGAIRGSSTVTLNIRNSTIANNSAPGAGGGGISLTSTAATQPTVNIISSIVAGNTNPTHPDIYSAATTVTLNIDGSYSLVGNHTDTDNIVYSISPLVNIDAKLAPLGNYGGPTQTHGLLPGSPALDAGGNPFSLTYDQRGGDDTGPLTDYKRVIDEAVGNTGDLSGTDIGSFEGFLKIPVAIATLPDLTADAATYTATVVYTDETGINTGDIKTDNVTLSGPGFPGNIAPISVSFTVANMGKEVTAKYVFDDNGSTWDLSDNGIYTLTMVGSKVRDTDMPANYVSAGSLGTFTVAIGKSIIVDTEMDVVAPDGKTSLREAITDSNTYAPTLGIADNITFDSSLTGKTIVLTSELSITDPVNITGLGAGNLTISGGGTNRIATLGITGAGSLVSIQNVKLTGGKEAVAGGAFVVADDKLDLINVDLTGNQTTGTVDGGAITTTTGTVRIIDSTISANVTGGDGGVIYVSSTGFVELIRSTVSGNSSDRGGFVYFNLGGGLTIIDSTLSGNSAADTLGGGAISAWSNFTKITNSTLSGNIATSGPGGAIQVNSSGSVTINNSTITRNTAGGSGGGGIGFDSASSVVTINSTIIAQNNNAAHPDLFSSVTTTLTIGGSNNFFGAVNDGDLNITGFFQSGHAKLGPLGSFGGPTQTHGLTVLSTAIDAGSNPLGLTLDQRQLPRPVDDPSVANTGDLSGTDIGSYEGLSLAPAVFIVDATLVNISTGGGTAYNFSVQFADDVGIILGTLGDTDIEISGTGFEAPIFAKYVSNGGAGQVVTANYTFTPPDGSWDAFDDGTYSIKMMAGAVGDGTNFAAEDVIGTFKVVIPHNLVVDNVNDDVDGDYTAGELTLREAIELTNSAVGASSTISFAAGLTGKTITLDDELTITEPVTINGLGSGNLTLSGNVAKRIFNFNVAGAGAESKISGMTLTKGKSSANGGAINLVDDSLTLTDVIISNSSATTSGGGISLTAGTLKLINSKLINNSATTTGGGFAASTGTVEITRSTVSGNSATTTGGGGYFTSGTLTVVDSTFSKNTANSSTTGGGGVSLTSGKLFITNSTFSTNSAPNGTATGGAIRVTSGTAQITIRNSTLAFNSANGAGGGGISSTSTTTVPTVTIDSTIIAKNVNANHPDLYTAATTISLNVNGDFNFFGSLTDPDIAILGANFKSGDPKLAPLANYGGVTETHALRFGSDAVNNGSNLLLLDYDQRGGDDTGPLTDYPRTIGGTADIGAYEGVLVNPTASLFGVLVNVPPTNPTYTFDVLYEDDGTIDTVTINSDDVTVLAPGGSSFAPVSVSSIAGGGGSVTVTYSFTPPGGWDFTDNGVYTVRVNANGVLDNDTKGTLETIIGTFNVGIGGSIEVDIATDEDDGSVAVGDISLREAIKLANAAGGTVDTITFNPSLTGKTILLTLGELKVTDGVVITGLGSTKLTIDGDAKSRIFNINDGVIGAGLFQISGMTLTKGKVTGDGGAIFVQDESLTLTDIVITNSSASVDGGAINLEASGAILMISASTFSSNSSTGAAGDGGAINAEGSATVTITNSYFDSNSTGISGDADGGALNFQGQGNFVIKGSQFNNNSAVDDGGAILFYHTVTSGRTVLIEDSAITNNKQTASGGYGGGINFGGQFDSLVIRNSTISGNSSSSEGGGIQFYNVDTATTIQNSTIAYNSANTKGGGLNQYKGTSATTTTEGLLTLESTIVSDNTATTGADIFSSDGSVTAQQCAIGSTSITTFTDIGGLSIFGMNLKLAPLAFNGGKTLNHLPGAGSPVLNMGYDPTAALTHDQRGDDILFPRKIGSAIDIGSIEVDPNIPTATTSLKNITTPGGSVYTFDVTYTDDVAINYLTIGAGDITITGPGFGPVVATFVKVDKMENGPVRIATYEFMTPGMSWDTVDNGIYTVTLNKGEVEDAGGKPVPDGALGTFTVAIPVIVTVDNPIDELDMDYSKGDLSLREAIGLVNAGSNSLNVINFDPVVFGTAKTIKLTLGEMTISRPVSIVGPGAKLLTIDGNNASRIFKIDGATNNNFMVTLSGMTITGGKDTEGGAIFSDQKLTIDGVWLTGNTASDSGGAIFFDVGTTYNVLNSSITGNVAQGAGYGNGGGAIYMTGANTVLIQNSTISNNQATGVNSQGGAIEGYALSSLTIMIRNSTITQNSVNGGGGGFIRAGLGEEISVESSIITGNTNTGGGQEDFYNVTILHAKNSIIGSTSGVTTYDDQGGNLTVGTDPLLNTLGDYGGPTPTHSLKVGSPAINAGSNPATLTTDQRGYKRDVGQIDIGAYELQPPRVGSVIINNGEAQRSRVTTIKVSFTEPVTFPSGLSAAFDLSRFDKGSLGSVLLDFVHVGADVTITFKAGGTVGVDPGNSLEDGQYKLKINADKVSGNGSTLDGDADYLAEGSPTDDHVTSLYRLFGDTTNLGGLGSSDGNVTSDDFANFRKFFGLAATPGTTAFALDFDNDGTVDSDDFSEFRKRFGLVGYFVP